MASYGLGIQFIDNDEDANTISEEAKMVSNNDENTNPIMEETKTVLVNDDDAKAIKIKTEGVLVNDDINAITEETKAMLVNDEGSKLSIASGGSEETEKALIMNGIKAEAILEEKALLRENTKKEEVALRRQEEMQRYQQLVKLLKKSKIYSQYLTDKIKTANKKQDIKNEVDNEDDSQNLKSENMPEISEEKNFEQPKVRKGARIKKLPKKLMPLQESNLNTKQEEGSPSKRRKLMPLREPNLNSKLNRDCVVVLNDVCKGSLNLRSSIKKNSVLKLSTDIKPIVPKIENNGISSLFTGGTLRDYQVEGFNWMKALFENGLNGILGDEMGLGKTVQCIALFSYLIENNVDGPFLVVAPLSTLPNWVSEFERFTPKIPVIFYYGKKADRQKLMSNLKFTKIDNNIRTAPVIITSYEVILVDQYIMRKYNWKYIVVDEGHRIKNKDCKLIGALKSLTSKNRLLLTGTPLQNDLSELWSLLNFLLPELFHDLNVFESWFNISSMMEEGADDEIVKQEQEKRIISTLREILDPFLLRRVKQDVELDLPLKREYLLYVSLTAKQQDFYRAVLNKTIAKLVLPDKEETKAEDKGVHELFSDTMQTRSVTSKFAVPQKYDGPKIQTSVVKFSYKNTVMDLRKCVMHPYLIEYPLDDFSDFLIDENLVQMSGKVMVVDLLLKHLLPNKHKVLIFSQMVEMLNILHDFCWLRNYKFCRLDGTHDLEFRKEEITRFNNDPEAGIFLVSTRAGGLGLNLMAADTVILFDSDWNPQADLQAMARCHRIGQVKPVIVYRLVVANTIDEHMINRAKVKRKLEKMIIHKDQKNSKSNDLPGFSIKELLELLKSEDHDRVVYTDQSEIFTKEELDVLLDRSFSSNAKNIKSERVEILDA